MKDEYKKDHTFYGKIDWNLRLKHLSNDSQFKDTADHSGHYSKHGSDNKKHHSEEGEKKKGNHHDSASKGGHNLNKGGTAAGHYDKNDEGYNKKSGHSEKHNNSETYAKKGDKDHHSEHVVKH